MFDLNAQLRAWKQSFDGVEALRGGDVKELEQHVRDSVGELAAKGLTQEEAFAIAIRRVGDSRLLMAEFRKVNGNHVWAQRAFWMIVGFLALQSIGIVVSAAANAGQLLAALAGGGRITLIATPIIVTAACWLGIVFGLVRTTRDSQGGPLAKFSRTRRWQLIGFAAIVPLATIFVTEASYLYLRTFMSLDEFRSVAYFRHLWAEFVPVVLFVLLIVAADQLRRTACEAA